MKVSEIIKHLQTHNPDENLLAIFLDAQDIKNSVDFESEDLNTDKVINFLEKHNSYYMVEIHPDTVDHCEEDED